MVRTTVVLRHSWLSMRTVVKNIVYNAAKKTADINVSSSVGDLPFRPGGAIDHIHHAPNIADIASRAKYNTNPSDTTHSSQCTSRPRLLIT